LRKGADFCKKKSCRILLLLANGAIFENGSCLAKSQVLELSMLILLKPILLQDIPLNDASSADQIL
jgi:hypothetical protein